MRLTKTIKHIVFVLAFLISPASALAQVYPTQTIRFIVPAPPGGAIDLIARVLSEKLTASLGQSVIVENKPGASGNIGTDLVAKAAPDGHTIGIVAGSHNINKFIFKGLRNVF
jgi:tripartite-type tricarboxylate transporter receptor subunit TctC